MKKLSIDEEIKHGLISCKYEYPATCKTYNKSGEVIATRTITHSIKATRELIKLQPSLAQFINTYEDDDVVKAPKTVQQMFNALGK